MRRAAKGLSNIVFYTSPAQECSYLPGRLATFVFASPDTPLSVLNKTDLSLLGFRRNGHIQYRPNCANCNQCISVRLLADAFAHSRTHKRLLAYNQAFTVHSHGLANIGQQHGKLYQQYLHSRHNNPLTLAQANTELQGLLGDAPELCVLSAYAPTGKLVAFMVCDVLMDGVSAVYTCYDTSLPSKHSLGTWMILQCIAFTQYAQLPYVYLGYYVQHSPKMNYKTRFAPLQYFVDGQWGDTLANGL